MSRIYEALRTAELLRSQNRVESEEHLGVMDVTDRRGSERWKREIDLTIYGHLGGDVPFYQRSRVLTGNANGGLILLNVPVSEGQDLLLINNRTSQEEIGRIVNIHIRDIETSEVAVVFSAPHPEFWEMPESLDNAKELYLEENI